MSGAEFVAVLGIGASVIAVVDACNKLRNRLKEFEDDETLRELSAQLQLFSNGIEILRQQNTNETLDALTQDALVEVLDCCEKRVKELDALIASALPAQKDTGIKRVRAAMRNLRDSKRVRNILNSLHRCQQLLVFHMASISRRQLPDQAGSQQGASGNVSTHDTSRGAYLDNIRKARPCRWTPLTTAQSCVRGTCGCACHRMTIRLLGMVSFNLPFPFLSECTCVDTTVGVSFFAMHRILSLNMSIAWMDGISIGTSLKFVNTVPYSCPGLAVLAKFSAEVIDSVETIETLSILRRNNLLDFNEVTLDNEGYLERALRTTHSSRRGPEPIMDVVRYLTQQGVQWRSPRPITFCLQHFANVYADGFSVAEFLGCLPPFDVSSDHVSYSSLLGYGNTRDGDIPDSLRAAFDISKSEEVYGGTPDLHDTIMTGSLDEVRALLKGTPGLHRGMTDVFGHSALHVAVQKPQILEYLLDNGFSAEVDARDHLEMTPLMYAAGSKQLTSAKLLLDHGANPWKCPSSTWRRHDSMSCAIHYALKHGDPSAFTGILDYYIALISQHHTQNTLDLCLQRLTIDPYYCQTEEERLTQMEMLMHLLHLGADPNRMETNGNTFLDQSRDAENGKWRMTLQNTRGYTILMAVTQFEDPGLVKALLNAGANDKITDKRNMSALHHAMERLITTTYSLFAYYHVDLLGWREHSISAFTLEDCGPRNAIASTVLLTRTGANLLDGDFCICYCSTHGCTPLQKLFRVPDASSMKRESLLYQLPWVLELSLVMDACGIPDVLKDAVRILTRQRLFEELEMTHTCCNERRCTKGLRCGHEFCIKHGSSESVDFTNFLEDMAEIQEEEKELGKELESKLQDSEGFISRLDENQLISQLADWAVELEAQPVTYMETVDMRHNRQMQEKIENGRGQITTISRNPVIAVDNSNGEILSVVTPGPLKAWVASDFINVYLEDMRKHPGYLDEFFDIGMDSNALTSRREALAKQLMEEIDRMRR